MKAIQEDVFADTLHAENCTENVEPSCAPVIDSCPDEAVDTTVSVETAYEPPRQGDALHRNNGSGFSEIPIMIPTGRRMDNM